MEADVQEWIGENFLIPLIYRSEDPVRKGGVVSIEEKNHDFAKNKTSFG